MVTDCTKQYCGGLLGRDADVNAQGGTYGDALYAASVGDHEKVVGAAARQGCRLVRYELRGYSYYLRADSSTRGYALVSRMLEFVSLLYVPFKDLIVESYKQGSTDAQIAEMLTYRGVRTSERTIKARHAEWGVTNRKGTEDTPELRVRIANFLWKCML